MSTPGMAGRWTLSTDDGTELVDFDSFIDMDYKDDGKVLANPVEKGSYASYNKIDAPMDIYVTLGIQGDVDRLQQALYTIYQLKKSTELFRVITPELEFTDMTLESYSYKRTRENGLGVVFVELHLVEVRQVETQYATVDVPPIKKGDAKNKSDASKVDKGKQQAKPYDSILSKL